MQNLPELHDVGLGENGLDSPPGELAAVVLHFSSDNGTTLGSELGPPVESTSGSLGLAIPFVEGVHGNELVLAVGGILLNSVDLSTNNQEGGLLLAGGEVKAAVLISLGGRGHVLLGGVVEGVLVGHVDLLGLVLDDNLVGEVVVDEGGLLSKGVGLVDAILGTLGSVERSVGGVLVDGDKVESGVVALVEEDLVALAGNDDIPRSDRAGSAHKHGEDVVSGEDGGFVLLGELLNDGVGRGGDVVGSTVDGSEPALGVLDHGLVVGAVVGVKETVVIDILTLVGLEVELAETVVVNLLNQLPVTLDVDRSITVALGLVIILPAEAATASTSVLAATTATVVATTVLLTTATCPLEGLTATTPASLGASTAALATTSSKDSTTTEAGLASILDVGDNGEGRLVLGDGGRKDGGGTGTVDLLVWSGKLVNIITLIQASKGS